MDMNWLEFGPRRLTKTHLAAYGRLADMISIYQSRHDGIDTKDSTERLVYAVQRRQSSVAQLKRELTLIQQKMAAQCQFYIPLVILANRSQI